MIVWRVLTAALSVIACALPAVAAQVEEPGSVYRVFLVSGEALPSYGEPAPVDDRVIFTLIAGEQGGLPTLQLVSLPVGQVDLTRTTRYTEAMRAARYAATRGEAEYEAISTEVARVLDQLTTVVDRRRRLELALEARRRLLNWSREHFSYRAEDIQELAELFDDVINQMRVAIGEPALSFDLVSMPASGRELLLPKPGAQEATQLALAAADAADLVEDRLAILKAAASTAGAIADLVKIRLDAELRVNATYAALSEQLLARAGRYRRDGNASGIAALQRDLERQDRRLGRLRPVLVRALAQQLDEMRASATAFRLALATFDRQRDAVQQYARGMRVLLGRWQELRTVLSGIRESRDVGQLDARRGGVEVLRLQSDAARLKPPDSVAHVHATLMSALAIAAEACSRRAAAPEIQAATAREAAAAAGGALLLAEQSARDLAQALRRPSLQ